MGQLVAVDMSEQTTVVPGYADHKDDHLKRLRRIEGQVGGTPGWLTRTVLHRCSDAG